jgi:hypothetical protein
MEGAEGVVLPLGINNLRKSPDSGKTLVPLTESDLIEFHHGNLFEDAQTVDGLVSIPKKNTFLSEERGSDGFLYVAGPMACCDKKNGNGRIYERGIWEGIKGNKDVVESITHGGSKGHLEHPKDGKTDLNLISHVMVPFNEDGIFQIAENGILNGKARILNTAPGKQLQELYRGGVKVGFSSRGKGSTFRRGTIDYVAKDYVFDTFDAVASPSVAEATPGIEENNSSNINYTLASTYYESIQSPTEGHQIMSNSKEALKQLEDGLRDIAGSLEESTDAISLASLRENLLDQQMAIRSVIENDPTTRDVAEELLGAAKDLRAQVTVKMESLKDHKLDEAIGKVTSSLHESTDDSVKTLHETLVETKDRLDYYRAACEELAESDDFVTRREYEAALALSEGLLNKCKEFQAENAELIETLEGIEESGVLSESSKDAAEHPDYKLLEGRYENALLIIEELTERIRYAQVSDRVEEVIKHEPRFARIRDDLLECKTVDEVNSRIERLERLFVEDESYTSLSEAEALAVLSESFDSSPSEMSGEHNQAPVLTRGQAHRMNLINALTRSTNFRK